MDAEHAVTRGMAETAFAEIAVLKAALRGLLNQASPAAFSAAEAEVTALLAGLPPPQAEMLAGIWASLAKAAR